jgi:uncharacterized protein YdaU (DUF1376 family)
MVEKQYQRCMEICMTTRRPWYPFYILDYRADTAHLTLEQHGAYRLLMDEYWLRGGLPEDDKQLARILGITIDEWHAFAYALAPLFACHWHHKRIEKELKKCIDKRAQTQAAADKRWKNKAKQKNANASSPHMLAHDTLHTSNNSSYLIDSTRLSLLPVSKEKQAKHKLVKKRLEYTPEFEAFWTAYPTDANMPKSRTWKAWQSLADDDRKAAMLAIPAFKAYCQGTKDYRPVYAERFLSQRRFDGYSQMAQRIAFATGVFIKRDTPQWEAWSRWWRKHKGKSMPGADGWNCPSEWPPNGDAS